MKTRVAIVRLARAAADLVVTAARAVVDPPHEHYVLRFVDTGKIAGTFADRDEALLWILSICVVPSSFRAYELRHVVTRRGSVVDTHAEW